LKAAFLQGIKIARYSSRVSHIRLDAAYPKKIRYIMRESISWNKCREQGLSPPNRLVPDERGDLNGSTQHLATFRRKIADFATGFRG
jgi:hypothetical protein